LTDLDKVAPLRWESKWELMVLSCLAPLLHADLRLPLHYLLGATDASNLAAGACVAEINHSLAFSIYDECEGPGEHVYLNCPYIRTSADEVKCSLAVALVVPLKWRVCNAWRFRVSQHINILEVQAVLGYIRWLISAGVSNRRIMIWVDSGVVKFAVAAGS
jgi:hypothetical protein